MQQFAICPLRSRGKPQNWVVVLQHDEMADWLTRVVAPLVAPELIREITRVHVRIVFDSRNWLLALDRLATVNRTELGPPRGSAESRRDAIVTGIDLIFTGY